MKVVFPEWKYRCSICGDLVHPDDVVSHIEVEKDRPTWPGTMTWTRVDDPSPDA